MLPSPPTKKKLSRAPKVAQKMAKRPAEGRQSVQLHTRCTSGSATPSAEFRAVARRDAAAFAARQHTFFAKARAVVLRNFMLRATLQQIVGSGSEALWRQHIRARTPTDGG